MAKRDLTQFDTCTAGVGVNPISTGGEGWNPPRAVFRALLRNEKRFFFKFGNFFH